MADNIGSKLGFDASDAIAQIRKLADELASYNKQLEQVAGGLEPFNAAQTTAQEVLKGLAVEAKQAVNALEFLSTAQITGASSANQFAAAQTKAAIAQSAFQKSLGINPNVAAQPFGDTLGQAAQQSQQAQSQTAIQRVNDLIRSTRDAKAAENELAEGAKNATNSANGLELSWRSVIRVFGIQFAAQAISSLVNAFVGGIDAARKFELQLVEIQTISKEFETQSIDTLGKSIEKLSADFGKPVEDVAKGLYQTLSHQIGNAAESLRFLNDALTFSVVTNTTTEESVNLLAGSLKAYGLTAASTEQISDQLFKTIQIGAVTGEDLSHSFFRLTPLSAQLGITIADLGGALATLTQRGATANEATTQLLNVELKLIKPTKELQAVFDELHVSSGEAGIAMFGLQGFLEKITQKSGDSASEIANLVGSLRASRGIIGEVGGSLQEARKNLDDVTGAAGNVQRAFALIEQTNAQQFTKELTQARDFIVNDFGRNAVAALNNVIQAVGGAKNALIALAGVGGVLIGGSLLIFFGAAIKAAITFASVISSSVVPALSSLGVEISAATASAGLLGAALVATPIAIAVAIRTFSEGVSDNLSKAQREIELIREQNNLIAADEVRAAHAGIDARINSAKESERIVLDSLAIKKGVLDQELIANLGLQDAITRAQARGNEDRKKLIDDAVKELQKIVDGTEKAIEKITSARDNRSQSQSDKQFARDIKNLDDQQKATAEIARAEDLIAQAKKAAATGTEEGQKRANKLLEDAFNLANKVADVDSTRLRGEEELNKLKEADGAIEATLINKKLEQKDAAEKTLAVYEAQVKAINDTNSSMNGLVKTVKELVTTLNQELNIKPLQKDAETATAALSKTIDALTATLKQGSELSKSNSLLPKSGAQKADDLATFQATESEITDKKKALIEAISKGDTDFVAAQQKLILDTIKFLQGPDANINAKGFNDQTIKTLEAENKAINDLVAAQTKLNVAKAQAANDTATETSIKSQAEAVKQSNDLGAAVENSSKKLADLTQNTTNAVGVLNNPFVTATNNASNGLEAVQSVINSFDTSNIVNQAANAIQALQDLAAAQAATGGGGFFAQGGMVLGFANGGFAPRGTDTVPAMLTPGEFVVNARDSKRFFSELVAMNSGRMPIFRQDGGSVTNNIGDININVPPGNGPVDTRELAKELRRQIKRRTTRF